MVYQKTQTSKSIKIEEKMSKKNCLLGLFRIFFNLGAILAHQTSTGMFSGSWRIFWHPWDPWGRINSGDIWVLRFVLIVLWRWQRLVDFSLFIKMLPNVSFTGCLKSIRTVGVASKLVEPHPLSFTGFFIHVKWKFRANFKQIGALMWK